MYSLKTKTILNSSIAFFGPKRNFRKIIDNIFTRNYTQRRALLYVPGDSKRKINSALNLNVDCVTMDCEDGVALNKKNEARETIHSFLNEGKRKAIVSDTKMNIFDWAVRVNPANSTLCKDDLKAILTAKNMPDTIILPKVNSTEDIKLFSEMLQDYQLTDKTMNLILIIESALSMINLPDICKYCVSSNLYKISSLIFGSDDFCADIGVERTESSEEILYARQKLVVAAKAFRLQAIDMVHINYKDLVGFKKECELGMKMGYTGKQVIHPVQVKIAQEAFLPNKRQIAWAVGLLEAFNEHQKNGIGAFTYKDSMIDMPTVKIAQNTVDLLKKTNKSKQ